MIPDYYRMLQNPIRNSSTTTPTVAKRTSTVKIPLIHAETRTRPPRTYFQPTALL